MKMLLALNEVKFVTFSKCLDVICDEGYTPYIAVDSTNPDYEGPYGDAPNGIVTLSIGASAVSTFNMEEAGLSFGYSTGGVRAIAHVPMEAIASVFAKENPSVFQGFPYKMDVDIKSEPVKEPVKVPTKPVKKGWAPKVIKGGKS
jgi:stringent starvation protein B